MWFDLNCTCDNCGKDFHKQAAQVKKRNFCSFKCSVEGRGKRGKNTHKKSPGKYVRCDFCGLPVYKRASDLRRTKKHFCGNQCRYADSVGSKHKKATIRKIERSTKGQPRGYCKAENNPNWRGGRVKKSSKTITCPKEFISMARKSGMVSIHRLLVAKEIGRCLLPEEVVCFIDGNKENIVLENLMLFDTTKSSSSFHRNGHPLPIWSGKLSNTND